jgi:hypothetical protein
MPDLLARQPGPVTGRAPPWVALLTLTRERATKHGYSHGTSG